MSRIRVNAQGWSEIVTTEKNVMIAAEGGDIRLRTQDPTGAELDDGFVLRNGDRVKAPPLVTVYATAVDKICFVIAEAFGDPAVPFPDPGTGWMALLSSPTGFNSAMLEWDFYEDPDPAHDSFELERKQAGGVYTQIATPGAGVFTYSDSGLTPGVLYTYRVRSVEAGVPSDWSNESQVFTAPASPINDLSAVGATATSIDLEWTPPSGFATQYRIYDASDNSVIDTIPAPATGYEVGSLDPETPYSFYVTVLYDGFESVKSNTVTQSTSLDQLAMTIDTSLVAGNDFEYLVNSDGSYKVDWGDGNVESFDSGTILPSHTYNTEGQYTVKIIGSTFTRLRSRFDPNIISYDQFPSNTQPYEMEGNASAHANLTSVPDHLPSNIFSLENFFRDSIFNSSNVVSWDVSNVQNFAHTFSGTTNFNRDISGWDVSSATNFSNMFRDTSAFNIDISGWNVSNVTNFLQMFAGAAVFNQPVNPWTTTSATSFGLMFSNAVAFDQPVGGLEIPNVTSMSFMFSSISISTANYDATLVGFEGQAPNIQNNVSFDGGNSTYTLGGTAETARTNLINNHGWTITDGGAA